MSLFSFCAFSDHALAIQVSIVKQRAVAVVRINPAFWLAETKSWYSIQAATIAIMLTQVCTKYQTLLVSLLASWNRELNPGSVSLS